MEIIGLTKKNIQKISKIKGESKFSSEEGKAQYNIHRNRSRHLGGVPGSSVVKNPPAVSGMQIPSLGWEDFL